MGSMNKIIVNHATLKKIYNKRESTMTCNYKVLSLMLLIGATLSGTFAKKPSHSSDSCNESSKHLPCPVKEDRFKCCDKLCCSDLCQTDCTIECGKKCAEILCFETGLSYQALLNEGTPPSQTLAPKGVCGKIQLCFDELMSKICYRITICGATLTGNRNTQVMGAFLYPISACNSITSGSIPIPVPLIPLTPLGSCGTETEPLCVTGTITMEALEASGATSPSDPSLLSIACIYNQAINNSLSVQVFGTDCVEGTPFNEGLLRGTLRPCYPSCHSRD